MKLLTFLAATSLIFLLVDCMDDNNGTYFDRGSESLSDVPEKKKSAEQLRLELRALEESNPMEYLECVDVEMYPQQRLTRSGNFFREAEYEPDGALFKGTITNRATLGRFKDARIKIRFYSQTNTLIEEKIYVIYEYLEPQSDTEFSFKIPSYPQAYDSFRFDLMDASVAGE